MDVRTEVGNLLGEKRALADAMAREFRGGTPATAIAAAVAPAFSHDLVTLYLAGIELQEAARTALREAGLGSAADVRAAGIDAPGDAWLNIAADPGETQGYEDLPPRIRAALRGSRIALDLIHGEHGAAGDEEVDQVLREGDRVLLIDVSPQGLQARAAEVTQALEAVAGLAGLIERQVASSGDPEHLEAGATVFSMELRDRLRCASGVARALGEALGLPPDAEERPGRQPARRQQRGPARSAIPARPRPRAQ